MVQLLIDKMVPLQRFDTITAAAFSSHDKLGLVKLLIEHGACLNDEWDFCRKDAYSRLSDGGYRPFPLLALQGM